MYYYVTIERAGQTYFVVSPAYAQFELSLTKEASIYLWSSEGRAREDDSWQYLIKNGDVVRYVRTYTH